MFREFLILGAAGVSVLAMGKQRVDSIQALQSAVAAAKPGEVIVIEDGVYTKHAQLEAKGTREKPVRIQAETTGGVRFNRPLTLRGSWLSLSGIEFREQSSVEIKGIGIRLSRCSVANSSQSTWVRVEAGSREVEIDHCLFENKQNNRRRKSGCQLLRVIVQNKGERHHIHHNHFRDVPKGAGGNGFETLQLITKGNPFDPKGGDCETLIEHNLFEKCNGEAEIISIKSNGNLIRRNTFRACAGGLVLRHGHRNRAIGNCFIGGEEPGSRGIRLQGRKQVVEGNCLVGLGREALAMMDGTPDDLYVRVEEARIADNLITACSEALVIGLNHSKHPNGTVPKDCVIEGNVFLQAEGGAKPLMRQVQGDLPQGWIWKGNLYRGELGIPKVAGLAAAAKGFQPDAGKCQPLSERQVGPAAKALD